MVVFTDVTDEEHETLNFIEVTFLIKYNFKVLKVLNIAITNRLLFEMKQKIKQMQTS